MTSLFTAGFRGKAIPIAVEAVADWTTVRGDEAGNALGKALEKVKTLGKAKPFGTEAIESLAEAGIRAEDVYAKLAKVLGTDVETAMGKVKAGLVESDKGIDAILATVNEKAGGAARGKAGEIEGLFGKIKLQVEGLFDDVDAGPLKGALESVSEVFGGPKGEQLKGDVTKLFGTLFKTLFGPFEGPDGVKKLESVMETVSAGVRGATTLIEKAGPIVEKFYDLLDGPDGKGSGGLLDGIFALTNMANPGQIIGAAIVDGLEQAIKGGASRVSQAVAGLANDALKTAKDALGIASPSKAFEAIGGFSAQGFVVGLEGGNRPVQHAGEGLATRAIRGAAQVASNDIGALAAPAAVGAGRGGQSP